MWNSVNLLTQGEEGLEIGSRTTPTVFRDRAQDISKSGYWALPVSNST